MDKIRKIVLLLTATAVIWGASAPGAIALARNRPRELGKSSESNESSKSSESSELDSLEEITLNEIQSYGSFVRVKLEFESGQDFYDLTFKSQEGWIRLMIKQDHRIRLAEYNTRDTKLVLENLIFEYCSDSVYDPNDSWFKFMIPSGEPVAYFEFSGQRVLFNEQQLDLLKKSLGGKITLADTELGYLGYVKDGEVDLAGYLEYCELPEPEKILLDDGRVAYDYYFGGWPDFQLTVYHEHVMISSQDGTTREVEGDFLQPIFYYREREATQTTDGQPRVEWKMSGGEIGVYCQPGKVRDDTERYTVKFDGKEVKASKRVLVGIMEAIEDSNRRGLSLGHNTIYDYPLSKNGKD